MVNIFLFIYNFYNLLFFRIESEQLKRQNDPIKGAPQIEEDSNDPEALSEKMAKVEISYEDESKTDEVFSKPENVSGADYLKQIYSGERTPHFQEGYDNLQKIIKKDEFLDSKGLV